MTKDEFIQRFQYNDLSESVHHYHYHSELKTAAVLIPIIEIDVDNTSSKNNAQQLKILFTKRASHLKHHGGQISFPGGKAESYDENIIATALRETQEEIGLLADKIEIIGQLHPYQTISGYIVTPIIAFIPANQIYTIDKNEVSEIFQVPLQHFLNTNNHHSVTIHQQNRQHQVHFMPYQHYNIWGATAAMLKDLALHLR